MNWAILTGEYPPQQGGVSDYTWLIAHALIAAGDTVHIWAPPSGGIDSSGNAEVTVHRLPDHFAYRSLAELERAFKQLPEGTQVLVQYVPHSYGWKAMNLPFCVWLWLRKKRHQINIMFHEVAFPWVAGRHFFRHNFLSFINRLMAALVARSARRIYISIPGWSDLLHFLSGGRALEWLPVPSNIPRQADPQRVRILRERLLGERVESNKQAVGHFGTFSPHLTSELQFIVPTLLETAHAVIFLCVGRGGAEFAEVLRHKHPALAARVVGTGELSPPEVAEHLAACDLLIQPYPDGISSRRGSAMAGLALGRPILTTRGPLTEPIWEASGAVRLVGAAEEMPAQAQALLADSEALARLGNAGEKLYREHFDLRHTIDRLRADSVDRHCNTQA